MHQTPVQVNVQDICFEKNLYELRNADGSFIARNTIEKTFGKIEAAVSNAFRSIKERAQNEDYLSRPKALVFPLTSRLVLYLYPLEDVAQIGWNYFFQLDQARIHDIQTNVAVSAREWIYSREKISNEQLEIIREARDRFNEDPVDTCQEDS